MIYAVYAFGAYLIAAFGFIAYCMLFASSDHQEPL